MSTAAELRELTYIRAVNLALDESLEAHPEVIVFGEDVAIPNGPYGATKGLHAKFGDRVFDTPISESAMVGAALGAAMGGMRPVVEIMFADFLFVAMDQIVNQIANTHYVSRGRLKAPLVIRTQQGHTPGSCAQHSQSVEALFAHVPGLRVAAPSTPGDVYSVLKASIAMDDPVIVFEARKLYPVKGDVAIGRDDLGVGIASTVSHGEDLTIVTWGTSRALVEEAVASGVGGGASIEIIDLRWISPWDVSTVVQSVARTGRLMVVHEANTSGGFGAEVVSTVAGELGSALRASRRVGLLGTPIPSSPNLAQAVLPTVQRISTAITEILKD